MQNSSGTTRSNTTPRWVIGNVDTPAGNVMQVKTTLDARDRFGAWGVRWNIGRGKYIVEPGLYAVGTPVPESPVLVTANYKMSFDVLRAQLTGRDAWILVLDTRGINVWCAAGKGTFGTDELVKRMESVRLNEIVSHRKLILPQLGATGVSAHQVHDRAGWRVKYGPVRAADLPEFLDANAKTTTPMRRVRFSLADRISLVPVELVVSAKYLLLVAACFVLLSGFDTGGYSFDNVRAAGLRSVLLLLLAYLAGAAIAPALLPWIPGAAFSLKGALVGVIVMLAVITGRSLESGRFDNTVELAGWLLLGPAIASFLTMNFTGASTYTSLSGVRREMRVAVPLQITAASAGVVMWVLGRFV